MSFPDVGSPLHALESTYNVLISFLDSGTKIPFQIYSDYTNYTTSAYEYSRQMRFRVKTPSNTNVFVDMGLDYSAGNYFYISKPSTSLSDPRNKLRINSDGKIFINYSSTPTREEKLQINGDLRTSSNINPTTPYNTTTNASVTNLRVTSLSCASNIVPPVGIIVMWDGTVANIPPGWELVDPGSGYYLRSSINQTSVTNNDTTSFTINAAFSHTHSLTGDVQTSTATHTHNMSGFGLGNYAHSHNTNNVNTSNHEHNHGSFSDRGTSDTFLLSGVHDKNQLTGDTTRNTSTVAENHTHTITYTQSNAGENGHHRHNITKVDPAVGNSSHTHAINTSLPDDDQRVNSIIVNLTPTYRQLRLIKKLAYT